MTTTVAALGQDIGLARETDYFLMKDQLTEAELGLLYRVRKFAEAEILPVASSYWERDEAEVHQRHFTQRSASLPTASCTRTKPAACNAAASSRTSCGISAGPPKTSAV